MFSRILTDAERHQIRAYMKDDGKRTHHIHVIVSRSRSYLPQIKKDLALIEGFLAAYEKALS